MTTRRIDPTLYVQAADAFDAVAESADTVGSTARSSANGFASMAGSDPGGEQFAGAYDDVAGAALQNIFDIGVRANSLDRLFMASGGNAASAEAVASGQPFDAGSFTLRPPRSPQSVAPPPSAFGGSTNEPTGWDLVMDVVGMMWPNADTDKLDDAARAWKDIARDVRRLATDVRQGDNPVASLDSVELVKARTEVSDFATDIGDVADLIEDLGTQCSDYADDVREAHKEVIEMLVQLAIEIAATVAISAALSAFTFGASAAAGAAAMTARIAVIGGRILTILTRVGGTAARVAVRIRAIRASLIPFALRHKRQVQAAIDLAAGTAAALTAEVVVKRGDANLLAVLGSSLVGGAVSDVIARPFGRYGENVVVRALAGGGGGAAGAATDGLISDGSVDPRSVVIGGLGGVVTSGGGSRSGSGRGSSSAADPGRGNIDVNENVPVVTGGNNANSGGPDGGGRPGTTDYEGPNVSGGNEVSGGGGDGGPAGTTDYEGPNVTGGNEVSGGGGDGGGGPRVPEGEAPTPTGGEGIPSPGGNGGGGPRGGNDPVDVPTPPVNTGGGGGNGLPPGSGSGNGSQNPGGYDPETPIFHDVENDLGMDVDGDGFPASSGGAGNSAPASSDPDAPTAGSGRPGDGDGGRPGDADGGRPGDADGGRPGDADGGRPGDADGGRPGDADGGRPGDADGGADPAPHTPDADGVPVTGDAPDAGGSPATPGDPSGNPTDAGDAPAGGADPADAPDSAPLTPEEFAKLTPQEQYDAAMNEISGGRTFADDAAATQFGQEHWAGIKDDLTDTQRDAVLDYTREAPGTSGVTYREINGALRAGDPYPAHLQPHIQNIDAAMNSRPLPSEVVVTRAMNVDHWPVTPQSAPGTKFDESSYLSTSLGGVADSFKGKDVVLHLSVPEKTPAMWVESVSAFGGSERELLLGRGLSWTATRSVLIDGQWHVFGRIG
ncbi:hypothetical protein E4V99_02295 [Microbacterium sp. dk485]|uniref:ADP-ribosyltransferase n=1 Tax=Microbacterium sp. dk485 TaxID=2560021 RepID=UPI001074411E|nr:ADP-ribosyltransferase [Microbacterium sp. dk485]TFV83932.1 hypothetical protein E4V99_02295 [Microbacterium sp. dk485]